MNGHVPHAGVVPADPVLDLMGDAVAFPHSQIRPDVNLKVNIQVQADIADKSFVHSRHVRNL